MDAAHRRRREGIARGRAPSPRRGRSPRGDRLVGANRLARGPAGGRSRQGGAPARSWRERRLPRPRRPDAPCLRDRGPPSRYRALAAGRGTGRRPDRRVLDDAAHVRGRERETSSASTPRACGSEYRAPGAVRDRAGTVCNQGDRRAPARGGCRPVSPVAERPAGALRAAGGCVAADGRLAGGVPARADAPLRHGQSRADAGAVLGGDDPHGCQRVRGGRGFRSGCAPREFAGMVRDALRAVDHDRCPTAVSCRSAASTRTPTTRTSASTTTSSSTSRTVRSGSSGIPRASFHRRTSIPRPWSGTRST